MATNLETLIFEIIARDKNASAAFDNLRRKVNGTTGSVDKNTASLNKNQQAQTSALGGVVGLGIALGAMATPLAAAGAGFTAFAGVAVPSVRKVMIAMTGPGGLTAAWGTLDKGQRNAALGVQMLGRQYGDLAKAMEPQVFQVFNQGLHLAGTLLGPISKLAESAGKGISSFLAQFTANSGIQQFIGFLAKEAGPAITLLGKDITGIAHAVFALLESFGGVGMAELKAFTTILTGLTSGITWLATHVPALTNVALAIGGIALALSKFGLLSGALRLTGLSVAASEIGTVVTATKGLTLAERGLMIQTTALEAITPFGWAVLGAFAIGGLIFAMTRANNSQQALIDSTLKLNHAQGFNTQGYKDAAAALGNVNDNLTLQQRVIPGVRGGMAHLSDAALALKNETGDLNQGISQQNRFLGTLQSTYGLTREQAAKLASAAGVLVNKNGKLKDGFALSIEKAKAFADANLHAQGPTTQLAADMADFANKTLTATQRTTALTNALKLFFNPAVTADQDVITLRNDLQTMNKALDTSGGKTGLLTQKQRDARGAFDTFINQVATSATDTFNATGKASDYNRIIREWLPTLEKAAGHNKALRHEIELLRQTLRGGITEKVTGVGSWDILPSGKHIPGFAPGGRIPGYGGGDKFPALLEGGEAVVPKHLTPSVAPFLKAHGVPGFAAGGVAGSYGPGSVAGLAPWTNAMNVRTLHALEAAVASAVVTGIRQGGGSGVPGNVASYRPTVLQVLSMLGQPLADAGIVLSQISSESGGNPAIVNKWDSNWLAGTPSVGLMQVIGPTFAANAGSFRNTGPFEYGVSVNPLANIYAGMHYAVGRYGAEWVKVLGHGHGYDDGGYLPPGLSLAYNGTGRPERVGGGGDTYNIVVNMPPGSDGADVVRSLQAYAKRNGPIRLKVRS